MYLTVNQARTYCYTGGKALDITQPTVVFIHGVLGDHSLWGLQSRYFANHGFNVLAIDLPGHGKSAGEAPASVEEAADFIAALLDAAGLESAALVGHSWGSLIALEAAARLKERISHLVLVGTAFPMKVSPALLEASLNQPEQAIKLVNVLSRSTLAPPPSVLGPGTWVFGASIALARRVLASNTKVNVFHRGFQACDSYTHAEQAMAQMCCPVLFVLGSQDQMTPPKAAQVLIQAAHRHEKSARIIKLAVGHNQMTEAPEPLLAALTGFLFSPSALP
jgi:pimeloyl-ACP methyl ester carboxylesterase